MDDRSQQPDPPTSTTGGRTQDLTPIQLPPTPSTPPSFGAPENTDAPPFEFEPAGSLFAKRPGTGWEDAVRHPLHREHAHLTQTPFADLVTIHPDDRRSLATGEPQLYPPGTRYRVAVTDRGPDEDGRSLLGFSQRTGPSHVHVSGAGIPENSLVEGTETVLTPIFDTPPSRNTSHRPLSRSDVFSAVAGFLNESLRRHRARDRGEHQE